MLNRGFTVIELMVALGLLSIVMLFVFDSFSYQHATYTVTDQLSEAQQNSRAIARLIERDVRNAGYLVPPGAAACGVDSTSGPDTLFISDTDSILAADLLPLELAGNDLVAETTDEPTAAGSLVVDVDQVIVDGTGFYDTDGDGTNDSDFRVGGGAIFADLGNPTRGLACGVVTAVDASSPSFSVTVNFLVAPGATATALKDMVLVPAHVYRITGTAPPRLERDGVLMAKDVEDFQVAFFYDDDEDGVVDAGEVRGISGNDYAPASVDGDELREVRVNMVLRTRTDDPRNPDNAGIGQQRENRATGIPVADGKHRRVHTATVRLRNLTL